MADIALLNDLSIDTLLFLPPWAVRELSSTQGSELLASCASGVVPFKESASRSESTLATDLLFAQGDGPLSEFAKGARGRGILFRKDLYGYLLSLKRLSADEKKVLVERAELLAKGQWVLVSNGECPDHSRFPFDEFVDQFAGRSGLPGLVDVAAELYRSEESLRKSNSKLAEVWTSVIGAAAIPFGGSTRRALRERLGTLRAGR